MRRASVTAAAIGTVAALAAPSLAATTTIHFDSFSTYNVSLWTGSGSGSIDSADFNVDGHPDIVVVDALSRAVSVTLNDGNGTFGSPRRTVTSLLDTYAVAAGDFDGDGLPDVAAASDLATLTLGLVPNLTVLLGRGNGTFVKAYSYRAGVLVQQMAVTDFDRDGRLDLAVVGSVGDVKVLRGNGDGSFRSGTSISVGGGTTSIAAVDLNTDGYPDVAVSGASGLDRGTVSVLMWDAARAELSAPVGYPVAPVPEQVAAGDLNGDGRPDLVTANAGATDISVLLNGPTGFSAYRAFRVGGGGAGVAIADFDRDGDADVAVGRSVADHVSVMAGDGTGSFALVGNYEVPGGPQAMAIEDFNGDGLPDIGAAIGSPGLTVLRNASR